MIKYNHKKYCTILQIIMLSIYIFCPKTVQAQCGAKSDCGRVEGTSNHLPKAKIEKIWADHNIFENNQKGMMLHIKFTIEDLKGTKCELFLYFHFKDGGPLRDYNGKYLTVDGMVAASEQFVPKYENTIYKNFMIFMPYDELHMSKGSYDLGCDVSIFSEFLNRWVSRTKFYHFQYSSN